MDTNKMRDTYEAWAIQDAASVGRGLVIDREGDWYIGNDAQFLNLGWASWQASREAVVVELGAPSHWVADYAACGGGMSVFDAEKAAKVTDPMCSKTPSYTIHALEKAGLKVAP